MEEVPFREDKRKGFQNLETKIINTGNRLSLCGALPLVHTVPHFISQHLQDHYSSFAKPKVLGKAALISSQPLFGVVREGSVKLHAISRQRRALSKGYFFVC